MKFNLILNGYEQFYPNSNKKIYKILVVNNNEQFQFMNDIFIKFNNSNTIIGLDFEFQKVSKETRINALTQINLENDSDEGYIFIFYPPNLTNDVKISYIKLLCNKSIIKILHGGESLDIPYLFDTLFNKNKKLIKNFIYNLYDTKFLCEYYHIENNINKKCSIYNLLEEFNIIGEIQISFLKELEEKLGLIHLVTFNINNLSDTMILYALYDVLYLPSLITKFIKISPIYKNIIKELTAIIYYYKRCEDQQFQNYKIELNNYYNNNLIEKYNTFIQNNNDNLLIKLSNITYFKDFIKFLIKYKIFNINNIDINSFLLNKHNIIYIYNKI
jgi:hypothetical protein